MSGFTEVKVQKYFMKNILTVGLLNIKQQETFSLHRMTPDTVLQGRQHFKVASGGGEANFNCMLYPKVN